MQLTKETISKLACPAGRLEYRVYDDRLPGFYVRVLPGGTKTWQILYRVNGQQRNQKLGRADVITPKQAFDLARTALGQVSSGTDPRAQSRPGRHKDPLTLGYLIDQYLAVKEKDLRSSSFSALQHHLLKCFSKLHSDVVDQVTREQIIKALDVLKPYAANRARSNLSALYSWAMQQGLARHNPVAFTPKPLQKEETRDRVLEDWEIAAIWNSCGGEHHGIIVKLLLLTGQRRDEVADIRWSELDLEKALWVIPGARTKNGKPHEVPLVGPTLEILKAQPVLANRDLIFGEGTGGFSGFSRSKRRLDCRCGAIQWRLHDLRRTMVTRMAELGIADEVIEATVNHVSGKKGGVAGVYNRAKYTKQKRDALEQWATNVMQAVRRLN